MKRCKCSIPTSALAVFLAVLFLAATVPGAPAPTQVFNETWEDGDTVYFYITNGVTFAPTVNAWHPITQNTGQEWVIASKDTRVLRNNNSRTNAWDGSFRSMLSTPLADDDWSSFTLSWRIFFQNVGRGTPDISRIYLYLASDGGDPTGTPGVATVPANGYAFFQSLPSAGATYHGGLVVANAGGVSSTSIGNAQPNEGPYNWTVTFVNEGANTRIRYTVTGLSPVLSGETTVARTVAPGTVFDRVVIRAIDYAGCRVDMDNVRVTAILQAPNIAHDAGEKITFEPINRHLGESSKETTFTIQNTGTEDLTIGSLITNPSSTFSVVSPTSDSLALAPEESQEIVLRFAETTLGVYTGTLAIASDDPDTPVLEIPLAGSVVEPNIEHDAGTTITFPTIYLNPGEPRHTTATFTIRNTGGADLTIDSLNTGHSFFFSVVSPTGSLVISPGSSAEVVLSCHFTRIQDVAPTRLTGSLTINSNDPDTPTIVIGLAGNVEETRPRLTLLQPIGGNDWMAGTKRYVTWISAGEVGAEVRIELWKGGLLLSPPIVASTANDGAFAWHIPPAMTPGRDYKVRIISVSSPSVYDESDNFFRISPNSENASAKSWTGYH